MRSAERLGILFLVIDNNKDVFSSKKLQLYQKNIEYQNKIFLMIFVRME